MLVDQCSRKANRRNQNGKANKEGVSYTRSWFNILHDSKENVEGEIQHLNLKKSFKLKGKGLAIYDNPLKENGLLLVDKNVDGIGVS